MKTRIACGVFAVLALTLAGCGTPLTRYEAVYERYYATTLGLSTSADVLSVLGNRDSELLSQSESVLAAWGKEGKNDRTHWFNVVAFEQDSAVAVRKYGFILEETAWGLNRRPRPALRFDAEIVMDPAVLDEPYPDANARRIAVLRKALADFAADAREVEHDSVTLRSSAAMVKQALNAVLVKLMQSPGEAARLPELEGLPFDHITLDESRIRMLIRGDVVIIKIKSGKAWFRVTPFEEHPDVINM